MPDSVRILAACFMLISLSALSAQDKKEFPLKLKDVPVGNSEQLLGSWEMQDADLAKIDGKATFEFAKDGKAKMSIEIGKQKPTLIEGTYKLDGDNLTLVAKKNGKDQSEVVAIKSITATDLVLLDKQKKEVRFKKPEPKLPPKDPLPKNPFSKDLFPKDPV